MAGRVLAGCDIRWLTGEPRSDRKGTNMIDETSDDRGESESSGEDVLKISSKRTIAVEFQACSAMFICAA